jgi:hypothetical protein
VRPRSFWIGSLSATLLLASCSSRSPEPPVNNNSSERIISSTPPFKTREPERYRAVRTITFTNAAGDSRTTTTNIARNQSLRREEEIGSGQPVVLLESEQGRFLLLPQAKIYADVSGEPAQENSESELDTSPERLLHSSTLTSTYEKLGSEVIAGRETTKYKVSVNTSSDANVSSTETVIWLDEKIGMPVRSETNGADGSKTVMELSKLELNADSNIFQIPADFEKVTSAELRRRLKS